MGLMDYQPPSEEVQFKGGSFELKGLSTQDFSLLLQRHSVDLEKIFDLYERGENGSDFTGAGLAQFVMSLISDAPGLVANAIALSAGEQKAADHVAKTFGIALQLRCLKIVGRLTFEEAGGVKKFVESLREIYGNIQMPEKNSENQGE
ncbi:tail assembly protein [Pectobacterium phage MA12]|uniref:Tail assembly protein n=1 Tax=Pectobacterium phage MA12 TaxID=2686474 RepID=A0A6B9RKX4_9CAUD|nr:tail length tape measure protein [Pectobacterium phage MA11]YP_010000259.1 tail length tape measure protein [Pectobacterium phage MA12]QGF21047.1 tail assembly chaperone [Pectobacterium phage MA11]QHI00864.1 tail assembly protein [Pectobacterium phage MA12]